MENANTQSNEKNFFNSIIYGKLLFKKIEVLTQDRNGKKLKKNCCVAKATLLGTNDDGTALYRDIDLIIRGEEASKLIWSVNKQWPTNAFAKPDHNIIANVRIGSIDLKTYNRNDGSLGATLSGTLMRIMSLVVDKKVIYENEFTDLDTLGNKKPTWVASGYVSEVKMRTSSNNTPYCTVNLNLLNGESGDTNSVYVNCLTSHQVKDALVQFQKDWPKGHEHKEANKTFFGTFIITGFDITIFTSKKGKNMGKQKASINGIFDNLLNLSVDKQPVFKQTIDELLGKESASQVEASESQQSTAVM